MTPLRTNTRQFLRYFFAGCATFILDFAILIIATELLGIHYILSATIGFIVGSIAHYLVSIYWIFDQRTHSNWRKEFSLFVTIGLGGLLIHNIVMWLATEQLQIVYPVAKIMAAFIVFVGNYILRKRLLFTTNTIAQQHTN